MIPSEHFLCKFHSLLWHFPSKDRKWMFSLCHMRAPNLVTHRNEEWWWWWWWWWWSNNKLLKPKNHHRPLKQACSDKVFRKVSVSGPYLMILSRFWPGKETKFSPRFWFHLFWHHQWCAWSFWLWASKRNVSFGRWCNVVTEWRRCVVAVAGWKSVVVSRRTGRPNPLLLHLCSLLQYTSAQ